MSEEKLKQVSELLSGQKDDARWFDVIYSSAYLCGTMNHSIEVEWSRERFEERKKKIIGEALKAQRESIRERVEELKNE